MKGGDYIRLDGTTVPLSPLLFVLVALAFALVALIFTLLNLWCVNSRVFRGSRTILEERERAKQDLAIRGAGSSRSGSSSSSPTPGAPTRRFLPNKVPRGIRLMVPSSSRKSTCEKKSRRGYRGTSFSLSDARKNSDKVPTSSSRISMHDLQSLDLENSMGGSFFTNARDFGATEQSNYRASMASSHHANYFPRHSTSSNPPFVFGNRGYHRATSSISRGVDLAKVRSRTSSIPVHPSPVERTYSNDPQRDFTRHPLEGSSELRRHATDPSGTSRRNSTLSILESSSSAEISWLDSSLTNSRIGSFSLASGHPLQLVSSSGTGSGPLSSGSLSPRGPLSANSIGSGSDLSRLPNSSRTYESDDGDAIEAATKLLTGTRKESSLR